MEHVEKGYQGKGIILYDLEALLLKDEKYKPSKEIRKGSIVTRIYKNTDNTGEYDVEIKADYKTMEIVEIGYNSDKTKQEIERLLSDNLISTSNLDTRIYQENNVEENFDIESNNQDLTPQVPELEFGVDEVIPDTDLFVIEWEVSNGQFEQVFLAHSTISYQSQTIKLMPDWLQRIPSEEIVLNRTDLFSISDVTINVTDEMVGNNKILRMSYNGKDYINKLKVPSNLIDDVINIFLNAVLKGTVHPDIIHGLREGVYIQNLLSALKVIIKEINNYN